MLRKESCSLSKVSSKGNCVSNLATNSFFKSLTPLHTCELPSFSATYRNVSLNTRMLTSMAFLNTSKSRTLANTLSAGNASMAKSTLTPGSTWLSAAENACFKKTLHHRWTAADGLDTRLRICLTTCGNTSRLENANSRAWSSCVKIVLSSIVVCFRWCVREKVE